MRVLIADDHDLLRDTLVMFLQAQGDIETDNRRRFPPGLQADRLRHCL